MRIKPFFVRAVVQSYLYEGKITPIPTPGFWKTKKLASENVRLTGRTHWPIHSEKYGRCQFPGCKSKVRTRCERCDVALCINDGHLKKCHTIK